MSDICKSCGKTWIDHLGIQGTCRNLIAMTVDRDAWKAKAERYCSIVDKIINVSGRRGAITGVEVQDILRASLQEDTP